MAQENWKNEIRHLIQDFDLPKNYKAFVAEIEKKYQTYTIPIYYAGNRNAFYYDRAYAILKPYILT